MTLQQLEKAQSDAYEKYQQTAEYLAKEYAKQSEYQEGDIIIDTKWDKKPLDYYTKKHIKEYIFGGYEIHWGNSYKIKKVLLRYKDEDKTHPQSIGIEVDVNRLGTEFIKKK